jgi:hypothetical protein
MRPATSAVDVVDGGAGAKGVPGVFAFRESGATSDWRELGLV